MSYPTFSFSDFVTTVTHDVIIPKVVDNFLLGNIFLMRMLSKAQPWNGGHQIEIPIKYQKATQLGSYSGFDTFGTSQTNERVLAGVTPREYYASIVLAGIQVAVNQGDAKILDLLSTEIQSKADDLRDTMGTDAYGDGTTNGSKALTGLDAIVDDGTGTATFELLSRSTYTTWVSTQTAQSGSLSLANLASDFDAALIGQEAPTIILTTPAIFSIYEALLTPTVQHQLSSTGYDMMTASGVQKFSGGPAAGTGFRSLYFRGVPVIADEKCTSGRLYMLNENHIFMKTLKHPWHPEIKAGFSWTGLKEPTNQDAEIGQLLWKGNLMADSCRHHSVRTGITS